MTFYRRTLIYSEFPWKPALFGHISVSVPLEETSAASELSRSRDCLLPTSEHFVFHLHNTTSPKRGRECQNSIHRAELNGLRRAPLWISYFFLFIFRQNAKTLARSRSRRSVTPPKVFQPRLCVEFHRSFAACHGSSLNHRRFLKAACLHNTVDTAHSCAAACFYSSCPHPGPQVSRTSTCID